MQFCVNDRYITALFIKTKVIFAFILLRETFIERTFENLKLSKVLVKVKYLESLQIRSV